MNSDLENDMAEHAPQKGSAVSVIGTGAVPKEPALSVKSGRQKQAKKDAASIVKLN